MRKILHWKMRYMRNIRSIEICSQHLINKAKILLWQFFQEYLEWSKNMWKGMRNLIFINKSTFSVPTLLSQNNKSITNPIKIEKIISSFFSTIAEKAKSMKKVSKKSFLWVLKNMEIRYLFFLSSYYIRDLYHNFFFKFEQIKWILQ